MSKRKKRKNGPQTFFIVTLGREGVDIDYFSKGEKQSMTVKDKDVECLIESLQQIKEVKL